MSVRVTLSKSNNTQPGFKLVSILTTVSLYHANMRLKYTFTNGNKTAYNN